MRSWFALAAAVLLVVSSPGFALAQDASPAASPADLPPLLAQWAAAVNSGDVDQVLALFTEDGLWEEVAIGLAARGPDGDRGPPQQALHGRARYYLRREQRLHGWRSGGGGVDGQRHVPAAISPACRPATGQRFSFRGASVFEIADGKIHHYTEVLGRLHLCWCNSGPCPAPAAAGAAILP